MKHLNDPSVTDLLNYLKAHVSLRTAHGVERLSCEQFVLEHGRIFEPAPFRPEFRRGPKRECFPNAFRLLNEMDAGLYCEGFAVPSTVPFPIHHAWCVTHQGKVLDPTWDQPDQCTYIGVPFCTDFVHLNAVETGYYNIFDNLGRRFEMETDKRLLDNVFNGSLCGVPLTAKQRQIEVANLRIPGALR